MSSDINNSTEIIVCLKRESFRIRKEMAFHLGLTAIVNLGQFESFSQYRQSTFVNKTVQSGMYVIENQLKLR